MKATILQYEVCDELPVEWPSERFVINTINPHSYCVAKKDAVFRGSLQQSNLLIPDGVGIVWAARRLPEIPFVVAGGVDKSLADLQNNSPENIQWLGFVKGNALDELYRNSRIIVVPGKWYEGFPNVITRAMQHLKPVITSNLGAMASIIDHEKNGLLVEPGNAAALKEAISKLYHQPEACMQYGADGFNKAQELYSSESIYQKLIEIYDVLNNKHAL